MTLTTKRGILTSIILILIASLIIWACTKIEVKKKPTTSTKNSTTSQNDSVSVGGGSGGDDSNGTGEIPLTEPSSFTIGISNMMNYGTNYFTFLNEVSGGIAKFWFYGKNNGQAYPNGKNGNNYETVSLASHSVNMFNDPQSQASQINVRSKCRYKIKDSAGNVVLFVEDTKGGGQYYGRSNNHPDNCNRYLPIGTYFLEYENISDDAGEVNQRVVFFKQGENNFVEYQINELVPKGGKIGINTPLQFTITDTGSTPNMFYKFNCNFLP